MLQQERHKIILDEINKKSRVATPVLQKLLGVSLDTVRRDLAELADDGKLVKVHGGAISRTFHVPFQQKQVYAQDAKRKIAEKAVRLLKDDMVILCGGGTIMIEISRLIPKNLKGTIFTVSPLVALEIAQRSTVDVRLIGGQLLKHSYTCTGATVISQLVDIRADLCLLGANGISVKEGCTDFDLEVAQVKKTMISSSSKVAVLCIAEKIDTAHKMRVARLNEMDYLITDLSPDDKKLSKYQKLIQLH